MHVRKLAAVVAGVVGVIGVAVPSAMAGGLVPSLAGNEKSVLYGVHPVGQDTVVYGAEIVETPRTDPGDVGYEGHCTIRVIGPNAGSGYALCDLRQVDSAYPGIQFRRLTDDLYQVTTVVGGSQKWKVCVQAIIGRSAGPLQCQALP